MLSMIKQLVSCLKQYKKYTALTLIFVSLEVVMEVIIPFLMANLIDFGINTGNMTYTIEIGAVLVGITVFSLIFGVLAGNFAAKASAGYARNLRQTMYHKIQDFSFSNIDKYSTSSIITRLTTDITNVQNAFQMITRLAVRSPLMLVFSLIMAYSINPELSPIFLFAVPILGVGIYFIMNKAHPIFKRVFKTYDKLNNVVQENVRGIRVVKSFVREDHEIKKFSSVSESIFQDFSKAEKLIAFAMPLMLSIIYLSTLLISWFGAQLIVSNSMTTGQLTGLLAYTMQILMSLMMLSMVFVVITISRASAERIVEILDEKIDLHNTTNPVYQVKDGSVTFQNVSFSYSKDKNKLCLTGINLDIKSGETVGIIGGTGSSKSSLVQLIPRLYDVTEGSVKVGGVDVQDYDIKTLRDQVGIVLQKNVLFSGSIKQNLRWGNENASDAEIIQACKFAQADEFIQSFPNGYDTHIEQGGSNVSGGQKQRLCIARTLLKKPKILILDDSTSAIDTRTEELIRRAFKTEIPGTTKIIIAQRLSSVQNADKIVVMDKGIIDAVGTHEELLKTNQIYQEVYCSQMKGGNSNDAE